MAVLGNRAARMAVRVGATLDELQAEIDVGPAHKRRHWLRLASQLREFNNRC